jgi:hypothetical protein
MVSLINKQLLLTAYAYLCIMEQQKGQQGGEALQVENKQMEAPQMQMEALQMEQPGKLAVLLQQQKQVLDAEKSYGRTQETGFVPLAYAALQDLAEKISLELAKLEQKKQEVLESEKSFGRKLESTGFVPRAYVALRDIEAQISLAARRHDVSWKENRD